jgi:hypothetical protein
MAWVVFGRAQHLEQAGSALSLMRGRRNHLVGRRFLSTNWLVSIGLHFSKTVDFAQTTMSIFVDNVIRSAFPAVIRLPNHVMRTAKMVRPINQLV